MLKKKQFNRTKYPYELTVSPWRSKKFIIVLFILSFALASLGVFGFLFYREYHRPDAQTGNFLPPRLLSAPNKAYNNDYWGVKFTYPGEWYPVIGSFIDGDYYFSSENIKFIAEQSPSEAIIELQTYHNLKALSFDDWIKDREENYLPRGKMLNKTASTFHDLPAYRYLLEPQKPVYNAKLLDILIVSKDEKSKYIFILESNNQAALQRFEPIFEDILKTVEFYQGFGS